MGRGGGRGTWECFGVFPFPDFFYFFRGSVETPVRAIPTGVRGHFRVDEETGGSRAGRRDTGRMAGATVFPFLLFRKGSGIIG